jgi:hypothetical protein
MEVFSRRPSLIGVCAIPSLLALCFVALTFASSALAAGKNPIVGDLGGKTLTPGVYNSASSIGLTGVLTLDGRGDSNSVFVFQAGSTLTTASASQVKLINGAKSSNVFWQVGSSATLGTGSTLRGTILALTSITVTTGVTVDGRVLARNGAVTLDTNTITAPTSAKTPIPLGAAGSFGVLAGSAITNTGLTTLNGDIGSYPTPTITGTATMVVNGTNHGGDAVTQLAKTHLATAYDQAVAYDNDAAASYSASQAPTSPTPINGSATILLHDNTATGATCPTALEDPGNLTCGHEEFVFPSVGVFTASVTYPTLFQSDPANTDTLCQNASSSYSITKYMGDDPCKPQLVTLVLCQEGTGVTVGDCPIDSSPLMGGTGESEASCSSDSIDNPDTNLTTYTITCSVAGGPTYHLIVVPNMVDTCPPLSIDGNLQLCSDGPGYNVFVSWSFSATATFTPDNGSVTGAGTTAPSEKFAVHGWQTTTDSSKWQKSKVIFRRNTSDATRCQFKTTTITRVDVIPNLSGPGGSADIYGAGIATDSNGVKTSVPSFHGQFYDGGDGKGTMDTVTFGGTTPCEPSSLLLTHGNIVVKPKK